MEGFIPDHLTKSDSIIQGKRHTCITCGLFKIVNSPKMKVQGIGKKRILIIGNSPTPNEDRTNKLWNDSRGMLLKKELKANGIDLHKDCWSVPALLCSSKNGNAPRNPKMPEILACRKNIMRHIKELEPKTIILFGWTAVASVIGDTWGKGIPYDEFGKWRGLQIPDQKVKAFICPVYHPEDLENDNLLVGDVLFKNDIRDAVSTLKIEFPVYEINPQQVKILDTEKDINKFLNKLSKVSEFAWDVETTGLKPHNKKDHAIACISFSFKEGKGYVFPTIDLSHKSLNLLRKVLEDPNIKKIAQNMKFENMWALNIWNIKIANWEWDTMQASHILNNISGTTGLKLQTYTNFGIAGYDDSISKYLKAKDANATNKVLKVMKDPFLRKELLTYCGHDSIFTLKLANKQRKLVVGDELTAYRLVHRGILALANAEQHGMRVNTGYLKSTITSTEKKIKKLQKELMNTSFGKEWRNLFRGDFKLSSDDQLGKMLYEVKKIKPLKQTKSGKGSTDAEVLSMYKMPELDLLLKIRKLEKACGTYLKGLLREQVDGIIHTFFNLHTVATYRSSSNDPNFQNQPKRDKEIMKLIRDSFIPSPGYQLVELDFSQLEVSIAASYHKDPNMLDYLKTGKDMHGDIAKQIFKIGKFDKHDPHHSLLRKASKNGFVFPQFYGDYYANNAEKLSEWVQLPRTRWNEKHGAYPGLAKHLINKGIKSFNNFVEHIKRIEQDFWTNRFPVYSAWKKKFVKKYVQKGSAKMHTGFVLRAPMGKNQAINAPVQGAAFHCLLWLFIEIDILQTKHNWKSRQIGQIHDAIVFDMNPDERDEILKTVKHLVTVKLPKVWPWINAPLKIEGEIAPIDEPWSMVEEFEF